ncbi:MAG: 3-isopropylmalate dehydratase small subunit [Chloroflexota bacterium]|nr:3-isopropylmalate dehydratase small subunit [Chloroflexota bacterium]
MEAVRVISGRIAPLDRGNVDTDQIMPKQFLKRIERSGFGPFTFYSWRQEPEFVLNRPEYQDARILVTGENFGCGSSREHAPWGLQDMGFQAIVAPSFGDIFRNNSAKIGLLCVELPLDAVRKLMTLALERPGSEGRVDLEAQTVQAEGLVARFEIDEFTRYRLLNGLDDIGLTLQHVEGITEFEAHRPGFMPRTLQASAT